MRTTFAAILLPCVLAFPLSVSAQAAIGIQLQNVVFEGHNASGACGPAQIEITGVDVDNTTDTPHLFRDYGASVRIQSAGKTLLIGDGSDGTVLLQNQNKLHCVATPSGPRLVVAAYCFSTYCLPISYTVIDPTSLRVLSRSVDSECDTSCASKALGTALPGDLTSPLNGS